MRPRFPSPGSRVGISLLELALTTALLALVATLAIPATSSRSDAVASARRQISGDVSLARTLAIVHNGTCRLVRDADGGGYRLESPTPAIDAALSDLADDAGLGLVYARRFRLPGGPPAATIGPVVGSETDTPFDLILSPLGGIEGAVEPAVVTITASGQSQTLTFDHRTGGLTRGPLVPTGGAE